MKGAIQIKCIIIIIIIIIIMYYLIKETRTSIKNPVCPITLIGKVKSKQCKFRDVGWIQFFIKDTYFAEIALQALPQYDSWQYLICLNHSLVLECLYSGILKEGMRGLSLLVSNKISVKGSLPGLPFRYCKHYWFWGIICKTAFVKLLPLWTLPTLLQKMEWV